LKENVPKKIYLLSLLGIQYVPLSDLFYRPPSILAARRREIRRKKNKRKENSGGRYRAQDGAHVAFIVAPPSPLHAPYTTLQRQNTEISKQIFPEKEYRGLSPSFHIHVSVSDLYNLTIGLPILLEEICRPILGLYKSLTDIMWKLGLRPRYSQKRNT
jgi:hypothetical protein